MRGDHGGTGSPPAGTLSIAATWSRWLVVGTVLVAGGHIVGLPELAGPIIVVVAGSGFVAGIPHGAVDHLAAKRLAGDRPIGLVVAVYAGVAASAWALLQWVGPIALVAVVTASALHFGLGELEVSRQLTGWQPRRLTAAAIVVAGCGALLLPLARSGDQFAGVATAVSPGLAVVIGAAPVQIGLMATWLVAAAIAITASLYSGHRMIALDIVLIGAMGLTAPPLIAFAVWFGGWHAVRHTARMVAAEPGCAALLDRGCTQAAAWRWVRLAALPSLAAFTAVAALAWFTVSAPEPTQVVAEVLRLLLALTVPHMMVVLLLDRATDTQDEIPPRFVRHETGSGWQ